MNRMLLALTLSVCAYAADEAPRWPALPHYTDDKTGARVYMLTNDEAKDDVIYQTHPMWAGGMTYFLFNSDRVPGRSVYALEMATGEIRPVSPEGMGTHALSMKSDWLYGVKADALGRIHVPSAFAGTAEWEVLGVLPEEIERLAGGMFVGVDDGAVYLGAQYGESEWGISAFDTAAKTWSRTCTVDFKVGHVQANPERPGVVMFCHETGGDAPQRTWIAEPGKAPRPAYKETYEEWVTHEAWWGPEEIIFTIWPYDDERTAKPHGVVVANVQTGDVKVLAQYPAWHTHGSPGRRWAMGDDFDRNIWLIDREGGEKILLTQGHRKQPLNVHPHASFTPDGTAIVFNSSRNGTADIYMVEAPVPN